jgi:membrane protein YdbS with pleckstrin-like domain
MPIDFNNTITSLSKKTFGSTFLSSLFGNTISISFMISLVVILIIMIMYPAKSGTKFTIFAKMMIYIYFSVLLITFLHDSVVKYKIKEDIERNIEEDSMNNMTTGDNIIYSTKTISPTSSIQQSNNQQSNIQQSNIQQSNIQQSNNQQTNDNSTDEITVGDALPRVKFGGAPVNIFAL